MPTYDYQCRACGLTTEVIHSMLESGPTVCEQCGGDLRRVLYPAGIIFKGSGFYRTDSRADGSTASSDNAPKKTDPGSAGSSEKSGSTPAGETASPKKGDSSAT